MTICEACGKPANRRAKMHQACRKGKWHANYNTGQFKDNYGYVLLSGMWDHPNCDHLGRVKEHRYVMSQKLGRALYPGENVHHINGVKDDNRPENLELWVTTQPAGQRPQDLLEWAQEIFLRYGGIENG